MLAASRDATKSGCEQKEPAVYVELLGRTYRLPGPLALVQTDGTAVQQITHVNGLSLKELAASCTEAASGEAAEAGGAGGLLTRVCRGSVAVQALTVVAVHAGLLAPQPLPAAPAGQAAGHGGGASDAAAEQRPLLRAAARLTWGLAGLVFELMHCQAGHWPALGPVERQAVAGAALTQLYRLNHGLALGVLRAYGQLTPARYEEMLEHGLLPAPGKAAAAAAGVDGCAARQTVQATEEACAAGGTAPPPPQAAEEAAAQV